MEASYSTGQQQEYAGGASGPRAGFGARFGAYLLDGIIVGVIEVILQLALKGPGVILSLVFSIGYYTYFYGGPAGQTLGMKAANIRIISLDDGGPLGFGRGFIRWIGQIVSFIVILLGYFWMLWDPEKQCWHDKFAGSVVVPVAAYPV